MISIKVPAEFLASITMKRFDIGSYVDGLWVDGGEVESTIQASYQPLTAGDYRLLPEGNSSQRGWKVFWNGDFNLGDDGQTRADEVFIQGKWFRCLHKEEWQDNGYSAATFIEVKNG